MRLRPLDFVITIAAIAAIVVSSLSVYSAKSGPLRVVVTGRDGEWIYPLDANREIDVAGPLGTTKVEIQGKVARVEDSPCANKTCIAMGGIASAGQWVACLPNKVLVRIEGGASDGQSVDAGVF